MTTDQMRGLENIEGLIWQENGQSVLSGEALALYLQLDQMFSNWASTWKAESWKLPIFISAKELAKLDYFHSFPHLVTMPVTLDCSDENLNAFSAGQPIDASGVVNLTNLSPVQDVLTPAACYHFYVAHQSQNLLSPKYLTTCANCFRRETHYLPLQRQWSFSMREIVCIGSSDEVKHFLETWKNSLERFFAEAKLEVQFENATDPFFNPSKNPKYLMQRLDPVKTEMIYKKSLAIGSINFHRSYFGEAFKITRDGEEAYSGCVAFGMERWLYAVLTSFGSTNLDLPQLQQKV